MSTSIETQEMINLAATAGGAPDTDGLKFVLAEDLQQPRRRNLHAFAGYRRGDPSGDSGGHPVRPPTSTASSTAGLPTFPQYASNIYADLNAADGYIDLHPYLLPGWPAYFDPRRARWRGGANPRRTADVNTSYFLIPTQDLPLLDELRDATRRAFGVSPT